MHKTIQQNGLITIIRTGVMYKTFPIEAYRSPKYFVNHSLKKVTLFSVFTNFSERIIIMSPKCKGRCTIADDGGLAYWNSSILLKIWSPFPGGKGAEIVSCT